MRILLKRLGDEILSLVSRGRHFAGVFLFLLVSSTCIGKVPTYEYRHNRTLVHYAPWFTGPLLSPTPVNMKPGHPSIEPSITYIRTYGEYDSNWQVKGGSDEWSVSPYISYQMGFTDRIGLQVLASFISNHKGGASSTRMQDSLFFLGFQIASDTKDTWIPNIRLDLIQSIPTGSYKNLNPEKLETDITGQGSYQTGPLLIVQKLFELKPHFLSLKLAMSYLFPSSVWVRGFNTYGGGFETRGKVRPGQSFALFFSAEYSINENWGCGFDSIFTTQGNATFSGNAGRLKNGMLATVGLPTSFQINFAPFVEYNCTSRMGVLFELAASLMGKNASAFIAPHFAFVYTF